MLSRKLGSIAQLQFSKKSISFSRFTSINCARHNKLQNFGQPVIQTRLCQTTQYRNTSYPFEWKRKEYDIPKLPPAEVMPAEVDTPVIGSDMPIIPEHLGKVINYTPNDQKRFWPEGLSGRIVKDLNELTDGNVGLLIRDTTLQTISFLQKSLQDGFRQPYLFLDGREGSGKSIAMNQAVHWARTNGWLVLFVNSGFEFMRGNFQEKSLLFPEMYEQPELGEALLNGFIACHEAQLKTLKLRTDFTIPGFERNENSTLYDLCKFGAEYEESIFSCAAVYHLRRELNLVTEFPVLIAVDGVNHFFGHSTTLYDPLGDEDRPEKLRHPLMPGDKFLLATIFRNYKKSDMLNGTQIVSMSHFPQYARRFMKSEQQPDPANVIEVPKYSKEEFSAIINYYAKSGIIAAEWPTRTREYAYYLHEGLGGPLLPYIRTVD